MGHHDPYRALYIHIPFCAKRCAYCDFSTRAIDPDDPEIGEYCERLVLDIRAADRDGDLAAIETIYIGGGTPSFVGMRNLGQVLYALSLAMNLTSDMEITMEANPESLTEPMVRDLWQLGVNRLSIGVQSFDDDCLRALGRIHDGARARDAIDIARTRFDNVSVDLMCAIPGQTDELFARDLHTAIDAGVSHISVYPLTIEEGTPFHAAVSDGSMEEPDDDTEAEMMSLAADVLTPAGFTRYEVASYARPGFASRHNTAYWTGVPYLGIGTSAVTMTQNEQRRMRVQDGQVVDDLDRRQMCAEDLMLGMRMSCGIDDARIARATELLPALPATLRRLEQTQLIEHARGAWTPTVSGWLCGNELYGALWDLSAD